MLCSVNSLLNVAYFTHSDLIVPMVVCSVATLVSLSAQSPILGEGNVSGTFYKTLPIQWAPLTPPDLEYEH